VRRAPVRLPLCTSVPCGRFLRLLPGATSGRGTRHADRDSQAGTARSRVPRPLPGAWGGASGVSVASWSGLMAVPRAAGLSQSSTPPTACSPTGAVVASGPGIRSPEGVAGGRRRCRGRGRRERGACRGRLCRVRSRCPVWHRPAGFSHMRRKRSGHRTVHQVESSVLLRAQGAECSRSASVWRWYCVAHGRRGREQHADRLTPVHARRPRAQERGHACALGCFTPGGTPGPVGTGQVGSRGHSGAEQCTGADRANGSVYFKHLSHGAAAHRGRSATATLSGDCIKGYKTWRHHRP